MAIPSFKTRDTRDRLIDILGFGKTYPLRDLPTNAGTLMVPFKTTAKIPVGYSQKDVLYQLYLVTTAQDGSEQRTLASAEVQGNGDEILLESSAPIQERTTFIVRARKRNPERITYLLQKVDVEVGLDTKLKARISSGLPLDSTLNPPPDDAPRIVDYGTLVNVQLEASQEGVDYRLVYLSNGQEIRLSNPDVRGDLSTKTLTISDTSLVKEDIDVRIRATKVFDPTDHRETQTSLLDIVLPLKVRANIALKVTAAASIIDYKTTTTITISGTQASATYQLFVHSILDSEFVHDPTAAIPVVTVSVGDGEPEARISTPSTVGSLPAGYTVVGAAKSGTGSDLTFTTPALTDDSLFIIQAKKDHQAGHVIASLVQLTQVTAVLVRPDPAPGLEITVAVTGTKTSGDLELAHGQPGVFYYLRKDPTKNDLGLPAYFYKHDADDPTVNKGLGQLATEVDFVVANTHPPTADTSDLSRLPAERPSLATGSLDTDTPLTVFAIKAQSRVSTLLKDKFQLRSGPEINPTAATVTVGEKAEIKVTASRADETYQLVPGQPVVGTGGDLTLESDPLQANTTLILLIQQTDSSILVGRILNFPIQVQP